MRGFVVDRETRLIAAIDTRDDALRTIVAVENDCNKFKASVDELTNHVKALTTERDRSQLQLASVQSQLKETRAEADRAAADHAVTLKHARSGMDAQVDGGTG